MEKLRSIVSRLSFWVGFLAACLVPISFHTDSVFAWLMSMVAPVFLGVHLFTKWERHTPEPDSTPTVPPEGITPDDSPNIGGGPVAPAST